MSCQRIWRTFLQPSLFRPLPPRGQLPEHIRASLVPLLRRLLEEAAGEAADTRTSEVGHDENNG